MTLTGKSSSGGTTTSPKRSTNRLAVYRRDTRPVADYYRELGVLLSVDAARQPAEIQASLRESLAVKA